MILLVAVRVRADVCPDQIGLSVANLDMAVFELHLARAHRFYFCSDKHDAGLEGLENLVVVSRLAVAREPLVGLGPGHHLGAGSLSSFRSGPVTPLTRDRIARC